VRWVRPWGSFKYTSKVDVFTMGLILTEMCIIMTDNERKQIFAQFRNGDQCSKLENTPEIAQFVALLTHIDADKRPTCKQMLSHSMFTLDLHSIVKPRGP
ncbi:hypothetical protein PMAYCL1PPCAC_08446, partial [Pristionchus mayeri]